MLKTPWVDGRAGHQQVQSTTTTNTGKIAGKIAADWQEYLSHSQK